ncbi:MAG: radical SAM protein [Victivallales bacterium]|nr:radical SAM protein [Victivallales bacterium]MCF7889369.1 radical SAM protein [Victivallales bacterium]
MTKKRVIFIEPLGNKANVFDNYMKLPLVGPLYLGTILYNNGYDVKILNENIIGKQLDPYDLKADIFCLTALTVSANRAKVLAGQLKKLYPESKVLFGGIHASLLPDEFINLVDHVIVGEAEDIIIDIIEGKYTQKVINGTKCKDLDKLPLINYSLLDGFETIDIVPVMTSRGCPFDCNFCTVTKIFGKQFRMQSPERILAEIENAARQSKYKEFFFYDDNFSANKKRINKLCDLMIEKKLDITWFAQVRTDLAKDPDLIKKMVNAGLRWVQIGFESINDETLKAYHKSQTRKDIEDAIEILHYYGVNIHGMFMFGDDNDNTENIRNTVDFAIENNIDTVQFMILTPFPGTKIYETLDSEGRIFHKNWDFYNAMFVVFHTKQINPAKLIHETFSAYKKFYSIKRTLLESVLLCINIISNAFSWNFKNSKKYGIDTLFIRIAAKIIIQKYKNLPEEYVKYIEKIEKDFYLSK